MTFTWGQASDKAAVGNWDGDVHSEVGIFRAGQWIVDYDNIPATGPFAPVENKNRTTVMAFGQSGDLALVGRWDDPKADETGLYRPSTSQFFLDFNSDAGADKSLAFGVAGDIGIRGDFNGDGYTETGIFRPNTSGQTNKNRFFLDFNFDGIPDREILLGTNPAAHNDNLPVVGDWDGDGIDSLGIFRNGAWYFDNDDPLTYPSTGTGTLVAEFSKTFGIAGDVPVVGNWKLTGSGDKTSKMGVFRGTITWYLDYEAPASSDGIANRTIIFGGDSADLPAAGNWDGDAVDEIGLHRNGISWFLDFDDPANISEGSTAVADRSLNFGIPGDKPLGGRWERG